MSGRQFEAEDGSEETGDFPVCGTNGSFRTYRHDCHIGGKPPEHIAAKLEEQRARLVRQGAARKIA